MLDATSITNTTEPDGIRRTSNATCKSVGGGSSAQYAKLIVAYLLWIPLSAYDIYTDVPDL